MPMMANIRMNRQLMIITLKREGRELKSALTTNFKPSFLLIMRKGLSALKALRAFKDFKDDF
jgi:hypothetical protein